MENIRDTASGRTSLAPSVQTAATTSRLSSKRSSVLKNRPPRCLRLVKTDGPTPTYTWEPDGAWLTGDTRLPPSWSTWMSGRKPASPKGSPSMVSSGCTGVNDGTTWRNKRKNGTSPVPACSAGTPLNTAIISHLEQVEHLFLYSTNKQCLSIKGNRKTHVYTRVRKNGANCSSIMEGK